MNAVKQATLDQQGFFFPINIQIKTRRERGVKQSERSGRNPAWLKGSSVHQVLEFRVDERKHDGAGSV